MHTLRQKIFFLWFIPTLIFSESIVEELLANYSQKNDLSQKTIDQNKGHLLLFTRDKLERMHAKTLKDVFKAIAIFSYNENRYAVPDPLSTGSFEPYRSNFIRIYIDGVEITQGWVGSGLFLYGDINIDFVDHIEFYDVTPSFESILEPAYMTIFLYSKEAPTKAGGELNLMQGSRGFSSKTINYGHKTEDYSYMMNFSHTNAQREKINNGTDKALVRDFEQTQLFSYIKTDKQIAHLQIMKKNTHNLGGPSFDATPLVSNSDYLNIHMDYGINFLEHWNIKLAYDWFRGEYHFEDDFAFLGFDSLPTQSIKGVRKNSTYTAEINYKNIFGKHHVHTGFKIRSKVLDSSPIPIKSIGSTALDFTEETFYAFYAQDQYHLDDNQLFTYGLQYSHIRRNGLVENNDLLQLRLGYIISNELWSYKTYIFRSMFTVAPSTRELVLNNPSIKPKIVRGITQEISYKKNKHDLRLILSFLQDKDNFSVNMDNTSETNYSLNILNYQYHFDRLHKMDLQIYYAYYADRVIENIDKDYGISLSFSNSYKNIDFYNGIIWNKNSLDIFDDTNYFDWTSTISWNISHNLSLTLKGENILDRAKESSVIRINPQTGTFLNPLLVSPFDQRIILELEYTF